MFAIDDTRMNPAEGIQKILLDPAFAAYFAGWAVNTGRLTDAVTTPMMAIRNTGGPSGEPSIAQDYPSVQILARGPSTAGGQKLTWQKLDICKQILLGIPSRPLLYPNLSSVTMRGDITDAGYDEKDRPIYSVNFQLIVFYDSSGHREA